MVSGIGCSSRFPYYVNSYGIHSIHGRATAVATGLRLANPNLSIWVITGDGDSLSIGGNHTMHLLRRNVNLNVLLFNNQIYGLTKGQYSPTSEPQKITSSTPFGSIDHPLNPLALAMGADGSFIARSLDRDPKHLQAVLTRANQHQGTSFVEIYQNCNIFNDGAFEVFTESTTKKANGLFLQQGEPLTFGNNNEWGIRLDGYKPQVVSLTEGSTYSVNDLWVHEETDLFKAQILVRFFDDPNQPNISGADLNSDQASPGFLPRPFGVIYTHQRPAYDAQLTEQITQTTASKGKGNLNALLVGTDSWTVV